MKFACIAIAVLLSANAAAQNGTGTAIRINRQAVDVQQQRQLEMLIGAPIRPGAYWYDAQVGAWGYEGSGTAGMLPPFLPIEAPLPADASGAQGTAVFVNGRELHSTEVRGLQQCTPVRPGRYWLRWDGWGGVVGQGATFNLKKLCAATGTGRGRSGLFSYGSVVADDQGFGFVDSDGRSAHGGW